MSILIQTSYGINRSNATTSYFPCTVMHLEECMSADKHALFRWCHESKLAHNNRLFSTNMRKVNVWKPHNPNSVNLPMAWVLGLPVIQIQLIMSVYLIQKVNKSNLMVIICRQFQDKPQLINCNSLFSIGIRQSS